MAEQQQQSRRLCASKALDFLSQIMNESSDETDSVGEEEVDNLSVDLELDLEGDSASQIDVRSRSRSSTSSDSETNEPGPSSRPTNRPRPNKKAKLSHKPFLHPKDCFEQYHTPQ